MEQKIIGIDIGGTYIKIGIINLNGEILSKWEIDTNKQDQGKHIVHEIWTSIQNKLTASELEHSFLGIGIGVPGVVDETQGKVLEAVNIGWKNYELKKYLKEKTDLPIHVENDANTAALGEYWRDTEKNDDMIVVTLGTGVGSGIITDGKILRGHKGLAGEIGHFVVNPNGHLCNCDRRGCLETIASATGIVREAMKVVNQEPTSRLAMLYKKDGRLTAKDVFDLAKDRDAHSIQIINQLNDDLGFVLANVATIVNPAKILIGGGLSKAGDAFLKRIRASFWKHSFEWIGENTKIEFTSLGNNAGIIGAAYLIRKAVYQEAVK
ncbi:glucokinase [Peribacillus butanolivorans]|uniref:ROK family glucokinase n=1 Tax=Peribacillus butanolivorans TaxID=421767 RepID=UPI0006A74B21|nr:ROK family glucokinase [Peribacillus butanolivorans]KON66664.1 glucokinase [Peribacillus butanolivorans]